MSTVPTYKPLEIEVTDFGPIAKAKLDLRPLTVFVGPSNTGKSYLATLIYALHRFYGGYRPGRDQHGPWRLSTLYRSRRTWGERQALSKDDEKALFDFSSDTLGRTIGIELPKAISARVPGPVAALIRPALRDIGEYARLLEREIARCFGSEETEGLIRYGSTKGVRVALVRQVSDGSRAKEPLTHEFSMTGADFSLSASIPDSTPLQMVTEDHTSWNWQETILFGLSNSALEGEVGEERNFILGSGIAELVEKIGSSIIGPLGRAAHYLPADRAGVMHSHRVVVASLIERSSRAGFQRDEPLPVLSGVLGDFLEQLVTFSDSPRKKRGNRQVLATRLEERILSGQVREDRSATGYPLFSYRPAGHKKDVPLMRASSMVSELAPVVLYLRHLVQPGDVLIIEEPESHLHPGMQAEFTRQLAAVVRKGVRVMLTTHSDYVLEELANLVRMSDLPEEQRADLKGADAALSSDEVGVWLFEPGQQQEGSVVREIPLDVDSGTFPAGYGAITEALYNTSVEIDSRIIESKNDQ